VADLPGRIGRVGRQLLLLPLSLSFEVLGVIVLAVLSQIGRPFRWLARLLFALLLLVNCVGTTGFFTMRTYLRGFQFGETNAEEVLAIARGIANPVALLACLGVIALALLFGREGSIERQLPGRRGRVLVAAVGGVTLACVIQLFSRPTALPTIAYSPAALFFDMRMPVPVVSHFKGTPAEEDWAPVTNLGPRWAALAKTERHFNIVVLVMESTRSSSFWPSPQAPALPHVSALADSSVMFTRAYAHEPLSLKAFEALEFGTYPDPAWERDPMGFAVDLDSLSARWRALGMRTALIEDSLPMTQEQLSHWGFSDLVRKREIFELDPSSTDRTLVKALGQFLERTGDRQFGAILWTRQTHFPYEAPDAEPVVGNPKAAYQNAVATLDDVVADLTALLERRQLRDNTVLVLVGDHGEAFGEHVESGSAHGAWLFEESVHVPLMLINPRLFHGEREAQLVQQKDLPATLAWLAGDPRPNLNEGACLFYARRSQTAYLTNPWDIASVKGGIVRGSLKYLVAAGSGDAVADERLYDLLADPMEQHDLWRDRPADGLILRERFFGWLEARRKADRPSGRPEAQASVQARSPVRPAARP
jgi:hypothetical protein